MSNAAITLEPADIDVFWEIEKKLEVDTYFPIIPIGTGSARLIMVLKKS